MLAAVRGGQAAADDAGFFGFGQRVIRRRRAVRPIGIAQHVAPIRHRRDGIYYKAHMGDGLQLRQLPTRQAGAAGKWTLKTSPSAGKIYTLIVRPFDTANVVKKGHRLRLDIFLDGSAYTVTS